MFLRVLCYVVTSSVLCCYEFCVMLLRVLCYVVTSSVLCCYESCVVICTGWLRSKNVVKIFCHLLVFIILCIFIQSTKTSCIVSQYLTTYHRFVKDEMSRLLAVVNAHKIS
jgi:hypothetical protein